MGPVRGRARLTYEDYAALPETGPRYQLIEGQLIMTPSPTLRHQIIVVRLVAALESFVRATKLGELLVAPFDVILSQCDVLQPDVLYVSRDRRDRLSQKGVHGAPDLCFEVLSPRTRKLDLGPKRALYARHGVRELWVVEPEESWIDVYRLEEDPEGPPARLAPPAVLTTALLPGFSLDLAELFAD